MNGIRNKRLFWSGMTLAILVLIYWFSAQSGEVSSTQSGFFRRLFFFWLDEETGSFITRKLAHFTIYFLLGISSLKMMESWSCSRSAALCFLAVVFVFLSAGVDEFHQTFVSQRAGQFRDVLLDTAGGTCGILAETMRQKCTGRRRKYG